MGRYKIGDPLWVVSASGDKPVYGYVMDSRTFAKKSKVQIGNEYEEYGFATKKDALKFAYKVAKSRPQNPIFIKHGNRELGRYQTVNQVNYSENPNVWFCNKVIIRVKGGYKQLKSDGTIGKYLK